MRGRADVQHETGPAGGTAPPGITPAALVEALFAQQATGVAEIDLYAGRALRFNSTLVAMLGFDARHPSARQFVVLAGSESQNALRPPDVQVRRHDGAFIRVRLASLTAGAGTSLLIVAPTGDRSTDAERTAKDFRDIYENVSEGIYRSSLDGRQVSANPALVRLNGYETEAEMLAAISDIGAEWYVEPGRRLEFARLLDAHGRLENFVSEIYRHKTRERIWISENARLVRDRSTGAPLYYEGTVRDVTETVRRLQLERRLSTIIETIADGVITTDAAGTIQSVNRAVGSLFGWPADGLQGKPLATLLAEPDGAPLLLGAPGERRARGLRHDGSVFVADLAMAEADDQSGRMAIWCVRDATARSRYEAALREAKEAAERANRAKSDFLAMMSHELRTPLNAVIGMAGLLLDGALEEAARAHAETLREAADHLMQVINNVLDFSKLEAGRMEFEDIPFAPEGVVHGVLDLLAPRARAKGLDVGAWIAPDVPAQVGGDPGRLRQVLINLIGNAIKFTEHGAVSVEVERLHGAAPGVGLAVAVHDTGIGISEQQIADLFQDFIQLDRSMSRRYGGTGLGLAICSRLVAGMGGSIGASSRPGRGSTFRFTVQLRDVPGEAPDARTQHRLDGLRLLLVDDDAISSSLLSRPAAARGAQVVAVTDAAAALAELRAARDGGAPFDAALIDHLMPGTDGVTLGAAIRADPALAATRLVLASSGLLDGEKRAAAGFIFDRVLDKPVAPDVLVHALRGGAAPARAAAAPPADRSAPANAVRVLVAEDNLTNQVVIRAMVQRLGHLAHVVGTGEDAVAAVRAGGFDVVLMDVMMPGMDGIEATREIRALPAPLCTIPVFGLTAHIAPDDHVLFRAAGMDSVLTKPVTAKALAAALAPVAEALGTRVPAGT